MGLHSVVGEGPVGGGGRAGGRAERWGHSGCVRHSGFTADGHRPLPTYIRCGSFVVRLGASNGGVVARRERGWRRSISLSRRALVPVCQGDGRVGP